MPRLVQASSLSGLPDPRQNLIFPRFAGRQILGTNKGLALVYLIHRLGRRHFIRPHDVLKLYVQGPGGEDHYDFFRPKDILFQVF